MVVGGPVNLVFRRHWRVEAPRVDAIWMTAALSP